MTDTKPASKAEVLEAMARGIADRLGLAWDLLPAFSDHFCRGKNHEDLRGAARAALARQEPK